jgi:ATP-binding cassette subfamily C (CFTR/MRP) protein 1
MRIRTYSQQVSVCSDVSSPEIDSLIANLTSSQIIENDEESASDIKKKEDGKLILEENIQTGTVKLNVLWSYFKASKMYLMVIFLILYVLSNISLIGSNLWLSDWSNDARKGDDTIVSRNMRLIIFTIIGLLQGIFLLFADFINIKMSVTASRYFHSSMLKSLLQSTLEFFERTPIGRVVNRFNRDMDAIERSIPESYKQLVKSVLQVFCTIVVIIIMLPFFAIPTVFLLILYFMCQVSLQKKKIGLILFTLSLFSVFLFQHLVN